MQGLTYEEAATLLNVDAHNKVCEEEAAGCWVGAAMPEWAGNAKAVNPNER